MWLSGEVRLRQDNYDMLRGADLIWDKSGEKQQQKERGKVISRERERDEA